MICSFVVDPEHFRKGVASSLLDHVLTKRDWTKAVVETGADNLPAIRLYEKFGFKEEKRWQIAELSVWKLRMVQISNK